MNLSPYCLHSVTRHILYMETLLWSSLCGRITEVLLHDFDVPSASIARGRKEAIDLLECYTGKNDILKPFQIQFFSVSIR